MGFSLNFVSLLAITLVTGILVDDAIVEIENIVRHMRMGKSAWNASIEAADEIGLAVVAITLTIVAVFAPVSFMGGIAGQYFKQFGLTVAAAVLVSLLVARLVTPVMAAHFLRPHGFAGALPDGRIMRFYRRLLGATLARPYLTLARQGWCCSRCRSGPPRCCRRGSSRRRTAAASSSRWSCRRAPPWPPPAPRRTPWPSCSSPSPA